MPSVFSDDEVAVVNKRYPRMERTAPGTIEGVLNMEGDFNGEVIASDFTVRITAMNPNSGRVPALYEIGGRTQAIGAKLGIGDLRKLHLNPDGTACVCVKQAEKQKFPPGSDLFVFIQNLAVPYLYWLVYYEQYGQGPWGDYAHGGLGLLEFYSEDMTPQTVEDIQEILPILRRESNWVEYHKQIRKPSGERMCLCGSGKIFRVCHKKAWQGTVRLHDELLRLGISPRSIFNRTLS